MSWQLAMIWAAVPELELSFWQLSSAPSSHTHCFGQSWALATLSMDPDPWIYIFSACYIWMILVAAALTHQCATTMPYHYLSTSSQLAHFLSLNLSTKPLATKFETGSPGSNPTYFHFSQSRKTMNWQSSVLKEVTICHIHLPKIVTFCDCWLRGGCWSSGRA